LNVIRPVAAPRLFVLRPEIGLSDDAVNATPTAVDLGRVHRYSDFTNLYTESRFYFLDDAGDPGPNLFTKALFRIGDASKLLSGTRHLLTPRKKQRVPVHINIHGCPVLHNDIQ
jgi:hypothetical protein